MSPVAARRRQPAPTPASPWQEGWHRAARRVPSPNFGVRPPGRGVSLAVIHSISLPQIGRAHV